MYYKKDIPWILDQMDELFKDYPLTELVYETPFQLLTAVLLSAQTTDVQVNKVTDSFFEVVTSPEDVVKLWEEGVKQYIKTVWLHKSKTKNLVKTAYMLVEKTWEKTTIDKDATTQIVWKKQTMNIRDVQYQFTSGDEILDHYWYWLPDTLDEMIQLAWVGIKTAKVVLYVLYGQRWVAVDTHVHRVMNRLWIVKTKTPEQTSKLLETKIPDQYKDVAHRVIIYFGRYLCKAKKPECERCPLQDRCVWWKKNVKDKK